jgi:hypothetical protein
MKGISLHIGLNNLDPNHYLGSGFTQLESCINDAGLMADIAAKQGFNEVVPGSTTQNLILSDGEANVERVKFHVEACADELEKGDIFLLTYSGHGSRIRFPDTTEPDHYDETWCLYNREFFDDEILELLSCFKEGVRILFISDSCHSGTIITNKFLEPFKNELKREGFDFSNFERKILIDLGADFLKYDKEIWERDINTLERSKINSESLDEFHNKLKNDLYNKSKVKTLFTEIQDAIYCKFKDDYNLIMRETRCRLRRRAGREYDFTDLVKASVIQISACQDDEITSDGHAQTLGKFTAALDLVWNDGNYSEGENYYNFYADIVRKFTNQTPGWDLIGINRNNNVKFREQAPFTL